LIEIDIKSPWKTAEQIEVKTRYTSEDIEGLEHLGFGAGIAPNLRGTLLQYVCQQTMDYSPIRWFFYCRSFQRFL
jgi:hypothetical protein